MAHVHNDECRRLHRVIESLVARQGISDLARVAAGSDVGLLVVEAPAHPASDTSDRGNVELEIESVRRALSVMGCAG